MVAVATATKTIAPRTGPIKSRITEGLRSSQVTQPHGPCCGHCRSSLCVTGHMISASSLCGTSSAFSSSGVAGSSPSHFAQSSSARMTGKRSWRVPISALAGQVMIVQLLMRSPVFLSCHSSHGRPSPCGSCLPSQQRMPDPAPLPASDRFSVPLQVAARVLKMLKSCRTWSLGSCFAQSRWGTQSPYAR